MKVLVTGGAGFIGSHVAEHLLKLGDEVVILDDLSGGFAENVPNGSTFVNGSILDAGLIENLFSVHPFDCVYHIAAYAAENLSHFIKRFNYTNNVVGSVNLLNAAVNHGTKQFIFTSSIAVYGAAQCPMTEDTVPQPEDSYGIAKYVVEQELRITKEMFGLDYVIFRPHNVYGPRQNIADRYRNVVGIFINQCKAGMPMTIFGDGEQGRAFSFIADVAPIIAEAGHRLEFSGQTFNIGYDLPCTINCLAELVSDAMGVPLNTVHLPARHETKLAFASHSKLAQAVTKEPTHLYMGIHETAKWAKAQTLRTPEAFKGIEITKNLPPSWR